MFYSSNEMPMKKSISVLCSFRNIKQPAEMYWPVPALIMSPCPLFVSLSTAAKHLLTLGVTVQWDAWCRAINIRDSLLRRGSDPSRWRFEIYKSWWSILYTADPLWPSMNSGSLDEMWHGHVNTDDSGSPHLTGCFVEAVLCMSCSGGRSIRILK